MSLYAIKEYRNEVEKIIDYGGTKKETAIRNAFYVLHYKPGNRSALEWILDQYKEKKPCDATIAEKFNTYKFPGYKEKVIDLLKRVCTVSVETMKIINQMPEA